MRWQDAVLTVGQLTFSLALIPSILSPQKPARGTCALTAATLVTFTVVYGSLGLWWSAASGVLCAALWGWLLLQPRTP